jgi:hypothetical protein
MSSFGPGCGQTEVSEEEREALTPYALAVLGDPPLKSDVYDVGQVLQDHVGEIWSTKSDPPRLAPHETYGATR